MQMLKIHFKKKQDGSATMTCFRADGTCTGQKSSEFFVAHDLCHYIAETTLHLKRAFYGMISEGWDISDFGSPYPRGRFPEDALPDLMMSEHCAGVLGYILRGQPELAAEYRLQETILMGQDELPLAVSVSDEQWQMMQGQIAEAIEQWNALLNHETLILNFPAPNA